MRGSEARENSLRLRWLGLVVAVMLLLTAGWPLLSQAVSDHRPIAPDTTLIVGPSASSAAAFTVGPGWSMISSESNPHLEYLLRRGKVDLTVAYVSLLARPRSSSLWAGLRQVIRITHPGVGLGAPFTFTTASGRKGMAGSLNSQANSGTATIVAAPGRDFAVEMILLAPRHEHNLNLIAGHRILLSLDMAVPPP